MARVKTFGSEDATDDVIDEIFAWVTEMEGDVPNHFYIEMNFPELLKAKLGCTKTLWQEGELSLEEIQHVGILVSKANKCQYCTAAFCTILNYGLNTEEDYVRQLAEQGVDAVNSPRLKAILDYALKVNLDAHSITDEDIETLRKVMLTDKGIVQLTHLVSDFSSYNRLNTALKTDYDYRDLWREAAFDWQLKADAKAGDNTRGIRT